MAENQFVCWLFPPRKKWSYGPLLITGVLAHFVGGGFKMFQTFLISTQTLGEMIQFDEHILLKWWFNRQRVLTYG